MALYLDLLWICMLPGNTASILARYGFCFIDQVACRVTDINEHHKDWIVGIIPSFLLVAVP